MMAANAPVVFLGERFCQPAAAEGDLLWRSALFAGLGVVFILRAVLYAA